MPTIKPTIQLDKDDPYNERRTKGDQPRYQLNPTEQAIIRKEEILKDVIVEFGKNGRSIPDILDDIDLDKRTVHAAILKNTYPPLREVVLDGTVKMFLDFNEGVSRKDILERLGMTAVQLRAITSSEDFEQKYNEQFLELRAHPTIRAVQSQIIDELLPKAYLVFEQILDNVKAPSSVRLKAAQEVMAKAGIQALDPQKSNRQELASYLAQNAVNIENVNIQVPIPPEFQEAVDQTEVIEGEIISDG
jgi:hypothetical protein